jgi:hypothetical protein
VHLAELAEETFVRELFELRYGVVLRKVPETGRKTFDFELIAAGTPVAAVEVKTLERAPMTEANGFHQAGYLMTRRDNSAARIGRVIHQAHKQLSTFDGTRVLVFLNDESMGESFLLEALRGYVVYGSGDERFRSVAARKIAEGDIREEEIPNRPLYLDQPQPRALRRERRR